MTKDARSLALEILFLGRPVDKIWSKQCRKQHKYDQTTNGYEQPIQNIILLKLLEHTASIKSQNGGFPRLIK